MKALQLYCDYTGESIEVLQNNKPYLKAIKGTFIYSVCELKAEIYTITENIKKMVS